MKNKLKLLTLGILMTVSLQAVGDMFLQLTSPSGDIAGESTYPSYLGWINLTSLQMGISNNTDLHAGVGGAGISETGDVFVVKSIDTSSMYLGLASALATVNPKATIVVLYPDTSGPELGRELLRLELRDVVVKSISSAARPAGDVGEAVTLHFKELCMIYTPGGPDPVKSYFGWDALTKAVAPCPLSP